MNISKKFNKIKKSVNKITSKAWQFASKHPSLVIYGGLAAATLVFALKAYVDKQFDHSFLDMYPNSVSHVSVDNEHTLWDRHESYTIKSECTIDQTGPFSGTGHMKLEGVLCEHKGVDINGDGHVDKIYCTNGSPYDTNHNGLLEGAERDTYANDHPDLNIDTGTYGKDISK